MSRIIINLKVNTINTLQDNTYFFRIEKSK